MAKTKQPKSADDLLQEILALSLEAKLAIHIELKLDIDRIQKGLQDQLAEIEETKTKMNGK